MLTLVNVLKVFNSYFHNDSRRVGEVILRRYTKSMLKINVNFVLNYSLCIWFYILLFFLNTDDFIKCYESSIFML